MLDAITTLISGIRQGGDALRQAIISVASQLVPGIAPFAGLVNELASWIGGSKAPKVEISNLDPIAVAPVNVDYSLAANINTALLAGRGRAIMPGVTVELSFKDGVGDVVEAKVAQAVYNRLHGEGLV